MKTARIVWDFHRGLFRTKRRGAEEPFFVVHSLYVSALVWLLIGVVKDTSFMVITGAAAMGLLLLVAVVRESAKKE